ncbi:MFS transporter [Salininema proteolyticum]|uniref:MFS transporter n=1 Tax=Salininema proteolyticum TaxID=1607685 RepID=A0ABV8TYA7_9ACTN
MVDFSRRGALANPDFRRLYLSSAVSFLAFELMVFVFPLVALLTLDATAFEMGLLVALEKAAFLLIGLPTGVWVDRMRRRPILIGADLLRGALLLSVPAAWALDALTIWQLYAVALLLGACTVFYDVAYNSFVPGIVGKDQLMDANGRLEALRSGITLAAPGAGGNLVGWLGAPVALVASGAGIAASAGWVARIKAVENPVPRDGKGMWEQVKEGFGFIWKERVIRGTAVCTGLANLFYSAFIAISTLYLVRDLGLSVTTVGYLGIVGGLGGVFGGAMSRRCARLFGFGKSIYLGTVGASAAVGLVGFARPGTPAAIPIVGAGMFLMTFFVVVYNVNQLSYRQRMTPSRILGRMTASVRTLAWGSMPTGSLIGGLVGEAYGARAVVWTAAIGALLAVVPLLTTPLWGMRTMPEPAEEVVPATRQ